MDGARGEGGMPRAFKVLGAVAILLVVGLLGVLVIGGVQEGPGGHGGPRDHGDGTHGDGNGPGDGHHDAPGNHSGARAAVTWTVEVGDNAFEPAELTIQVGDTVRWTHAGSNGHTVTSENDAEAFDSHPDCNPMVPVVNCMANGDTFEHTFATEGEFQYGCKVHASMDGAVTVLEEFGSRPNHHEE